MGDFLAPKRKDVVDRLRRRIEQYRCHHLGTVRRFDASRVGLHELYKQDTQLYQQRWLESKAKKAAKHSKVKDGGGGGGVTTGDSHRSLVNQKLKRKLDPGNSESASVAAEAIFQFDDNDQPTSGGLSSNQGSTTTTTNTNVNTNVNSSTNVGVTGQDGTQLPHVSVQIVQQISTPRCQTPPTIHTNVTVSSTLQARYPHNGNGQGGSPSNVNVHTSTSSHTASVSTTTTTNHTLNKNSGNSDPNLGSCTSVNHSAGKTASVHTSIECKQEPSEDVHCRVSADTAGGVPDLPFDELQDILDSIEKDEGIPQDLNKDNSQDLIKELNKFNAIYDKVQRDSENNAAAESSGSMFSSLTGCRSPGLCKVTAPYSDPSQVGPQHQHVNHASVPPQSLTPSMFDTAQAMGGLTAGGMGLPVRPPVSLVEATGPAAETLKQMAAQHQHQSSAPPYGSKSLDHFSDPFDPYGRRNGYPSAYAGQGFQPQVASTGAPGYPTYGQTGYGDGSQMGQYGGKPDLTAIAYGSTKPLTHFPTDHGGTPPGHGGQPGTPSSLQQLQNQVASHFSPMHITQTQHVQLSQGPHRVQLSQTQQVQMAAQQQQQQQAGPPGMSLSQQQSFSMGSHLQAQTHPGPVQTPPGMTMQRDMQFMQENMRRDHQQQQYMNRPPPEYKMHPGARTAGPPYPGSVGTGNSTGSSTPLQTMQNMVNQTPAYGNVKGEVGSQTGVMGQMSAVQSMAASINSPHMTSSAAQASQSMAAYQQQMPQRPPSYSPHAPGAPQNGMATASTGISNGSNGNIPGGVSNGNINNTSSVSTSAASQANGGYTSALMRNQRPPNVNVGPEGLNISQPRTHPAHQMTHSHADSWTRSAMMQGHMQGHPGSVVNRGGPVMGSSPVNSMGSSGMMPPGYGHRPGSAGSIPPALPGTGHPMMGGVGVAGTQVMMQQNVQMTQLGMPMRTGVGHPQQGMTPHSGAYSMVGPPSNMQGQSNGTPGPHYPGQEDFMQFLDSAQTPNFDSFDSMVQGSSSSDFSLFDEILNVGK